MSGDDIFKEIPNLNFSEPAVEINAEEIEKCIKSRRSVRVFTDDPIPEETLRKCLELGLLAPNSSNLQPWEFYVIKNPNIREKVVKACFSQPAAKTASELIVCVSQIKSWPSHRKKMLRLLRKNKDTPKAAISYYEKLVPFVYRQGFFGELGFLKKILFFFMGFFKEVPREPVSISQMTTWAHKTTALACENIMLALRAYGYDSCPMEGYDSQRIKKALKLKRNAKICMILGCGKRASNGVYGPRVRFPRDQFIKII